MMLMCLSDKSAHSMDIYYYNSFASRMDFRFNSDDGTLQQLKNAGNLRLIQKKNKRQYHVLRCTGANQNKGG